MREYHADLLFSRQRHEQRRKEMEPGTFEHFQACMVLIALEMELQSVMRSPEWTN